MKLEFDFRIVERIRLWLLISLAVMVLGGVFAVARGFNFGLDFTGGTMMQIHLGETVETQEVRDLLAPFELNEEILSAVEAGDGSVAQKAMLEHVNLMATYWKSRS